MLLIQEVLDAARISSHETNEESRLTELLINASKLENELLVKQNAELDELQKKFNEQFNKSLIDYETAVAKIPTGWDNVLKENVRIPNLINSQLVNVI